jgi:lambda repressor-like predicted transcriptional regulator
MEAGRDAWKRVNMGERSKEMDGIDMEGDLVAHYVRLGPNSVLVDLARMAIRHASGESLASLAKEVDTTGVTLRKHLKRAGLLVDPEERNTPLNRIAVQLPQGEVIERYEGGESVHRIVADLKRAGISVTVGAVEQVLDRHQVIRHANSGDIPRAAPQGFSFRSARDLYHAQLFNGLRLVEPPTRPYRFVRRADERSSSSAEPLLNEYRLRSLAKRHAEGKGESIARLARRAGIGTHALKEALEQSGYVVSTRSEWVSRELDRLTGVIVRMYRDEERDFGFILYFLSARDVYISLDKLRALLKREGVSFRETSRPAREKAPHSRSYTRHGRFAERSGAIEHLTAGRVDSHGRVQPDMSDPRWRKIEDRLDELTERIIDKEEPIQGVARDLEVDHNWLARALRQCGHLPDMSLHRYRKWKKMQEKEKAEE